MIGFDETTRLKVAAAGKAMAKASDAMKALANASVFTTQEMQRYAAITAACKLHSYMVLGPDGEPKLRADFARIVDAHHQECRRKFRGGKIEWDNLIELNAMAMKLWLRSL